MASRKGVGPTANIGGHPITERHTTPEEWLNPAFDLTEVIRTLSRVGAVTVPGVLRDTGRQRLIEQTVQLPFTDQPAVVGPYGVQQHYAAVAEFALGSVFHQLCGAFQTLLEQHLARLPCSPFGQPAGLYQRRRAPLPARPARPLATSGQRPVDQPRRHLCPEGPRAVHRLPRPHRAGCRGLAQRARRSPLAARTRVPEH